MTQCRDKRIEELEKRLKSMEDLVKSPVSNQQTGLNHAGSGNGYIRPESRRSSNHSEVGTFGSSSNSNRASTIAGEDSHTPVYSLLSSERKCESALQFPDLTVFSVLRSSR